MNPELPPLSTWQFYHSCRKILGMATLQKLFKRSPTQIYRWSRDPDFGKDIERNPLDRTQALLKRLCEIGRYDIARGAVSILAATVGCELHYTEPAEPDKDTMEAECLDDYPAVARLHQTIQNGKPTEVIRHLWQEAKRELDETYEMFVREKA